MQILRALLVFFLFVFGVVSGLWGWVQMPPGVRAVSGWLSAQLQAAAPKTRVDLEQLKLHWPPTAAAERAVWSDPRGRPILTLAAVWVSLTAFRLPVGKSGWEAQGQVRRLDLAALDRVVGRGELRADGLLQGTVRLRGAGSRIEDIELKIVSEQPGGNINSEIMERLAEMMPPQDARAILLRALGAKATFHFDVGKLDLTTEGNNHVLKLLLDGDHLLDLTVRVQRGFAIPELFNDLVRFLGTMKSKGEKR